MYHRRQYRGRVWTSNHPKCYSVIYKFIYIIYTDISLQKLRIVNFCDNMRFSFEKTIETNYNEHFRRYTQPVLLSDGKCLELIYETSIQTAVTDCCRYHNIIIVIDSFYFKATLLRRRENRYSWPRGIGGPVQMTKATTTTTITTTKGLSVKCRLRTQ